MTFADRETSLRGAAPVELYRFATGSTTFFYTSSDEEQSYLGDLYSPEAIRRSAPDQNGEASQASIEVTIPRTNPVGAFFIDYTPEPPMGLIVYRFHRGDPEVIPFWKGEVSAIVFSAAEVKLTCFPPFEALRRKIPSNTYQSQCNWALYSAECGVVQGNFLVTAQITVIADDTIQASAFASQPDGWFNNGWVEDQDGQRRWVVDHIGATITLMSPFGDLAVGDTVSAFAGCDRTEAICDSKFANLDNHLGFARVPKRNPFETGLV